LAVPAAGATRARTGAWSAGVTTTTPVGATACGGCPWGQNHGHQQGCGGGGQGHDHGQSQRYGDFSQGRQHGAPDQSYLTWRDRQNLQFDEDCKAFNSERQTRFEPEFDGWRKARSGQKGRQAAVSSQQGMQKQDDASAKTS
jgi:hypothetical protein